MIARDPNVQNVEVVAAALGDLRDELVLVGGCATSLLIDAPAPPPRVTYDVDLAAAVVALADYHRLERRFEKCGFRRDTSPDAPICRWVLGAIKVDLMPTDERVLGFSNRWYPEAVASAVRVRLPGGVGINLIAAPVFLATKFEAFRTRGNSDLAASHDFEDIVNVVEGRETIVEEIGATEATLREYLAACFVETIATQDFENALPGLVAYDELHGQRVAIVRERMAVIAALPGGDLP